MKTSAESQLTWRIEIQRLRDDFLKAVVLKEIQN